MENLKTQILNEFKEYWKKEDNLLEQNKQYFDTEKYTQEFIQNKKAELDRTKEAYRKIASEKFERLGNNYINSLKVDTDKIDSLEYQTKLANTLKLLELNNGNTSKENLEFLINARDYNTLKTLALKYNTNALKEAVEEANIEGLKYKAQELIYHANLNLRDFMGRPRKRSDVIQFFR